MFANINNVKSVKLKQHLRAQILIFKWPRNGLRTHASYTLYSANDAVDTDVKPAVLERIDPHQFGEVPKSSTTHALISMLHFWLESTDGNEATTRAWHAV